jgi:phage baseplate assembly protein gpV
MSQAVTVNTSGGSPTLSFSDGAAATYDAAASNPSTGALAFKYLVGVGDYTNDLETLGVVLNGAVISDAHGVNANFSAAIDDDLAIDVNAAIVTDVTASPSTGEADAGAPVYLMLTMSEAVTVGTSGGSPTLSLDDGGTATYDGAASNPSMGALTFLYTVGATDETADLQVSQVDLNGGTIDDSNGHAADLSAADDFSTGLQIGRAFVGSVTPSLAGEIFAGQTDALTLAMSQAVTVDTAGGSPALMLSDGATASYDAAAYAGRSRLFERPERARDRSRRRDDRRRQWRRRRFFGAGAIRPESRRQCRDRHRLDRLLDR